MKFLTLIFPAKDTFHYSFLPTFIASVPLPLSPAGAKVLFKSSCRLLFTQTFSGFFCVFEVAMLVSIAVCGVPDESQAVNTKTVILSMVDFFSLFKYLAILSSSNSQN